jgi:hypothetical protein
VAGGYFDQFGRWVDASLLGGVDSSRRRLAEQYLLGESDALRMGLFDHAPLRGAGDPAPIPQWGLPSGRTATEEITRWQQALGESPNSMISAAVSRRNGPGIGVEDGLNYDPLVLSGSSANAYKIESSLSSPLQQPMRAASGGATLDPVSVGMVGADLAGTAMELGLSRPTAVVNSGPALGVVQRPATGLSLNRPLASFDSGPALTVSDPAAAIANVSGGGPGTSTAKGNATIARAAAGRSGSGALQGFDRMLAHPGQSLGLAAEGGVRNLAAMADRAKMPNAAVMLKGLAPAARWAAPVAGFAATTGLPAVLGAVEGNAKAGAGGAVLQGGGALAGALVGQALIPVPFLGAAVGSMVGNAIGGGLTSGAQAAAEKAQQGDTGLLGNIGRAVDPFIDTAYEREQKVVQQQLNSPAMQAIQQQERARLERARADQTSALLMQAYLR